MQEITCSYNKTCFISIEEVNNIPLVKLDFNITSYKICKNGWNEYDFPPDIIINDKLYLDKKLKKEVFKVLSAFIKSGTISDITTSRTERGFSTSELKDVDGNIISIQDSSSAMESKIWFGCVTKNEVLLKKDDTTLLYEYPEGDVLLEDRLHLTKKQAKELKKAIKVEWDFYEFDKKLPLKEKDNQRNKI